LSRRQVRLEEGEQRLVFVEANLQGKGKKEEEEE
jgi:hypothetical protein